MEFPRVQRERGVNRFDPEYLAQWRGYYRDLILKFQTGAITRADAQLGLISLGYRSQALEIELLEFEKAKARANAGG